MSLGSRNLLAREFSTWFGWSLLLLLVVTATAVRGEEPESDYVPVPGEFPPAGTGVYLAGELVSVDHVNRRGALRLVGDGVDDRYHGAPSHRFAMLPYGTLRYHGAPAELRDIPIGTVLHGYFVLPPEGDDSIPRPAKNARFSPLYTNALTLEDDFSFYQRRGKAWKIVSLDQEKGKLVAIPTGPDIADGLTGEHEFEIDPSTRVWRGREFGGLEDLAADQEVQLNLTWAPEWKNTFFHIADVWIDEESRAVAAERQRQIHIRHQRHRWLAGWVDHVEHEPGGKGIVTVTLFGGMDPSLYDETTSHADKKGRASIAAAEWTLRGWWQNHDRKEGPIVDYQVDPSPPPGSSGLQVRVQISELLEGYRPGRIVRFRPNSFPNAKMPPEERIKNFTDLGDSYRP